MGVGAVREPPLLSLVPIRWFHLRLLTVFPLRGTGQRSNLFESRWSNQWLILELSQRVLGAFLVRAELMRGPKLFLPFLPVACYCQAHKKKVKKAAGYGC